MSLQEYQESQEINAQDYQFYALIMAAMRKADDINMERLRQVFPGVYNAPGGRLEGESGN